MNNQKISIMKKKALNAINTGINMNNYQLALTKDQLSKVKGGTWFEDNEEFVKQHDAIKER
jgi:hypothetical protein